MWKSGPHEGNEWEQLKGSQVSWLMMPGKMDDQCPQSVAMTVYKEFRHPKLKKEKI